MDLVWVGIGGACGSIARFLIGKAISQRSQSVFPFGTFVINLSGALLLGVVCGLNVRGNLYFLLADGFLGAYTTFSTFMYEGFRLFEDREELNAFVYVLTTTLLGLGSFVLGFAGIKAIL